MRTEDGGMGYMRDERRRRGLGCVDVIGMPDSK
jgi:hypothetical protein